MDNNGVGILAAIMVLSQVAQAWLTIHNARKEAVAPLEELREHDRKQDIELGEMKRDIEDMKDDINKAFDKERALEKNNLIIERGMLALISHEIDGNHTKDLEDAKGELEKVVWGKE